MAKKMVAKKAPKKKVAAKPVAKAKNILEEELSEGEYFTALYGGHKIRGQISIYNGYIRLANRGFGEESDSGADSIDYNLGFNNFIELNISEYSDPQDVLNALENEGISGFRIVTDKRQKSIIDIDKNPEIGGYGVVFRKDSAPEKDTFIFGCGDVSLSRAEIQSYLNIVTHKDFENFDAARDAMSDHDMNIDDIDIDAVKKLLQIK